MCQCCVNRRQFLGTSMAAAVGVALAGPLMGKVAAAPEWAPDFWDPERAFARAGKPLRVQPLLMYRVAERREMTSWKSWSRVQSDEAANEESERIAKELKDLSTRAGFPIEVLPVVLVKTPDDAAKAHAVESDITVVYPATGGGDLLSACVPERGAIVFLRHRSGPVYYWYEALSVKYLKTPNEGSDSGKRLSADDVLVDDPDELLWRLRALYGVRNFIGARVVALGGPAGKYAPNAPAFARNRFKLDIVDVSYDELGKRIESAFADAQIMSRAEAWTAKYLALPGTALETERQFVVNAFVLYGLFKGIMQEHDAQVFTINSCMNTIIPMSKTTACLPLGLLNDEGLMAFCESDFVVVPAGILLAHISGKRVFWQSSTFPHGGMVTCAHCTAPRRMDGSRYEPVRILTHYESEYGAAPKVEIPRGQEVTCIDPEYATGRWVGVKGTVEDNPFLDICRSQQDVRIQGNWKKLLNEVRDSHWMMAYGDHLKEIGYAAPRIGITWDDTSIV